MCLICQSILNMYLFYFLSIFRERGREGEREGEKQQFVVASHTPLTRDPQPRQVP